MPPNDATADPQGFIAALRGERDAALAREAALAEVLAAINRSPGDPGPVFKAILQRAHSLCGAEIGSLQTYDGTYLRTAAAHGYPSDHVANTGSPFRPTAANSQRLIDGARLVHYADIAALPKETVGGFRDAVELGVRTVLLIPLRKNGTYIGGISALRTEVKPFTEAEISLLESFAAQAVIAIQNARLLAEQREALEQQTATAEVLQVINASPGNLTPVFDAMLEKALHLCDAAFGNLWTYDGDVARLAAICGAPPEYRAELLRLGPQKPEPGASLLRLVEGEPFIHMADITTEGAFHSSVAVRRMLADRAGARTVLWVPMRKDVLLLGFFTIYRTEVRPFSDKQIALLQNFAAQAVIAMENARLLREQREALEQQTATAQVLEIINRSPGDLAPVFATILEKAHYLCGATMGSLATFDGAAFRRVATRGLSERSADVLARPRAPDPEFSARLLAEGSVQVADVRAVASDFAQLLAEHDGVRTILWVPLRNDLVLLGWITAYRTEVQPFSEKQVSLLQNFAAQAVIAIENARLLTEQREALEQQTATAEVLQVINSSPGDLVPVFDAILLRAHDLCEASFGALMTYDGERFRAVAHHGTPPPFRQFLASGIFPSPGDPFGRMVEGAVLSHTHDLSEVATRYPDHPLPRAAVDLGGIRTLLVVPLRKDDTLLGAITAYRQEVRPFSEKQIALLQNFAAQAVIAMENARLLNQQREALEQQTATAEVLQVINASPGNLVPVFDAILEKAHRVCSVSYGSLHLFDGEEGRAVAVRGLSDTYATQLRRGYQLSEHSVAPRLLAGERLVQIIDSANEGSPRLRSAAELDGIRTALFVPLRKDEALLGMIVSSRREVRPFLDKEVTLLENFAAQAVIAIENARLLTEQREALERQTATAEVLQIINASPGNLSPVFNAMLERAMRLCGAASGGLFTYDGERFHTVATLGVPVEAVEFRTKHPPTAHPGSGAAHILRTRRTHQTLDRMAEEDYQSGEPGARAMVELGGARTMLNVPLLKDDEVVGFFSVYRHQVRAFSDKQIALLENFAAQAVIAIENARLLNEQREALEQQTATAEVLQVINASPGNVAPVFDAMLERALRLCGAAFGALHTYDGKQFQAVALRGVPAAYAAIRRDRPLPTEADSRTGQMLIRGRPVQVVDVMTDSYFLAHPDLLHELVDLGGARSVLTLPLLKHGSVIGAFVIYRKEPGLWPDRQVALLENFAAQAVIAMENARLLTETREALEQQTATAEVLQVINSSPGNLAPVFDTILDKAHTLCGAALGSLMLYEDGYGHAAATHGLSESHAALARKPFRPSGKPQDLIDGARLVHSLDVRSEELHPDDEIARSALETTDIRTGLWVPLRKDGALLGWISAFRLEVRPFSDKEIALLESFAAQAVIAVENARLLTETREALEQQTATAEVLQVINGSPGDVTPVLDAILEKAHALCGAATGMLLLYDGALFHAVATRGYPENYVALLREPFPPGAGHQALIQGDRLFHVPDMQSGKQSVLLPSIEARLRLFIELGLRTGLLIPLRKDGVLLGIISAARREVRPFSDKEIALLENFAAQAVIAMENARLLSEIRQRQEELRVTFEHMGDGVAMFDETQRLVAWNGKFQEIFDLPDVLLGRRCTYEEYLQFLAARGDFGAGIDTVEQIHELVASTGQPYGYERTRPDGRVIEIRRNPVPDGGFVLIYSDITERKRSEAEIRAARDAAEAAYRDLKAAQANLIQAEKMASLGQLTAGIAHEIKNPLNFVNNFATLSVDLLDELKATAAPGFATLDADRHAEIDELTRTLASNLEKINEHGRRADGIVRSMLDHSRGSSGERRSVDLNALVDEALNLAYHGARAQDQSFNITLHRDFREGIAPITLAPQDITRVLLNLFGNGFYAARKRQQVEAAPGFEPALKVMTRELGDAVEIRVRDNGIGIPTEIKDKLFQPFFSTKPTGEGTGLGLSISYDIVVQQHGGTIGVDSKVGQYSEFTVVLPRIR